MERWVIQESEYNRMVEELSLVNISSDDLDKLATDLYHSGMPENECYLNAFNDLLEKAKEK